MKFLTKSFIALLAYPLLIRSSVVSSNDSMDVDQNDHPSHNPNTIESDYLSTFQNTLPFHNPPHLQDSLPYDFYILLCMNEWGFECFQEALKCHQNQQMLSPINKSFFTPRDFELIYEMMMQSEKTNWTKRELIQILNIGQLFLANGKSKKRIMQLVSNAILNRKFDPVLLSEFPLLVTEIVKAVDEFCCLSISIENEILQLNCGKFPQERSEIVVKYFLSKVKQNTEVCLVNLTEEVFKILGEQLKNQTVVFYPSNFTLTVSFRRDFGVLYGNFKGIEKLSFTILKSRDDLVVFEKIKRWLYELSIFNFEGIVTNPSVIADKMLSLNNAVVRGDLKADLFNNFYFEMKEFISKYLINSHLEGTNNLSLFNSPLNQIRHSQLFKQEKGLNDWENDKKRFYLDLAEHSQEIARYRNMNFSLQTFTQLGLWVDESKYLYLVGNALQNQNINAFCFSFAPSFTHYNQLLEIIKEKTIQSLYFGSLSDKEEGQMFLEDLSKTPLWDGLKQLKIYNVTIKTILKVLSNLPPNLEALELLLGESNNGQFGIEEINSKDKLKNSSVKELKIRFLYEDDRKADLEQLPLLFPNLKRLDIALIKWKCLECFEIKHKTLKEIQIQCAGLENEKEFITTLINSSTLESVKIETGDSFVEWKRENGSIYYEINEFVEPYLPTLTHSYEAHQ